ncbi:MAG TPA: metallophosphoesterase [Candidatus Polarisedimenticolaceae bacterium]|nr:metallophosphoesterase [Candidatus Polarisedimenticolaceae bacterium]
MLTNRWRGAVLCWVAFAFLLATRLGSAELAQPSARPAQPLSAEENELASHLQVYLKATDALRREAKKDNPTGKDPQAQASALEERRAALAAGIRALRPAAKPGEFFTPSVADAIKRRLKAVFDSPAGETIRDSLEEQNDPAIYKDPAATAQINQKIEAPQLPAVLRVDVPVLPEQFEYRFVGRTLVLADAEAGVVLDFIPDAMPERPPKAAPSAQGGETQPRTYAYLRMPQKARSVRFAVLGDTGTGDESQQKVATTLWNFYSQDNRFRFVLLLGDNLYSSGESAADYDRAFLVPYRQYLEARVVFHATLGNHDLPRQVDFPPFHMEGKEYYSFNERNARFISLNSNKPSDPAQTKWLAEQLAGAPGWKICFFHHPLYSSGTHASESRQIRTQLEDALVEGHVDVVFSGHEHFYERMAPQRGIQYFVSGAAAKLRVGDLRARPFTAFGYDRENSVMIVEISGDALFFQALGVTGRTIDCGVLYRTPDEAGKGAKDESTQEWLRTCQTASAWAHGGANRSASP